MAVVHAVREGVAADRVGIDGATGDDRARQVTRAEVARRGAGVAEATVALDGHRRQTAQGQVIGQKPLADEPVFHEGLAMADEICRMGEETLMAVVNWSSEYRTLSRMISSGSNPSDLVCSPPVMLANNDDSRTFADTVAEDTKQKPWWKFWG